MLPIPVLQRTENLAAYQKKKKALTWKKICTPVFITALFTVAKTSIHPWRKGWKKCDRYVCMFFMATWRVATSLWAHSVVKETISRLLNSYPGQYIKKQKHYFTNKGPNNQSYGFSISHVWMWELDHKESWLPKNWCFWTVVLKKTLESPMACKEIQPVHPKGNQSWIFIGRTDAKAEAPILQPTDTKSWLIGKDPDARKDWRQEEKGMTEDEMVGWHHQLDGHEFK